MVFFPGRNDFEVDVEGVCVCVCVCVCMCVTIELVKKNVLFIAAFNEVFKKYIILVIK